MSSPLRKLSEAATFGSISLNPQNRLRVRTSMDHPMCEFSEAFHRQTAHGEGADPEFMVALWNAYRAGALVELTLDALRARKLVDIVMYDEGFQAACQRYHHGGGSSKAIAVAALRAIGGGL